jgi:hypothetical protein
MYKKLISSLAIVAMITIAFLINSCQLDTVSPPSTQNSPRDDAGNGCAYPNTFCGSPGTVLIQNSCPGDVNTIDLWAGVGNASAGVLVGQVIFTHVSGDTWHVEYDITDPDFEITEAHFDIECTLEEIPQTHAGNPKPGKFEYTTKTAPWEFDFTLPTGCSCPFAVAAHAKGILGGHSCFAASIPPGCTNLQVYGGWSSANGADTGYYWRFDLSNAGSFNGNWGGWCIDLGTQMPPSGGPFTCARIYSSLDPLPPCDTGYPYIEHPENFDKVNYLLNNYSVGDIVNLTNYDCSLAGGTGALTVIDIQKAIWALIDLGPGNDYNEFSDSLRVNALLCDANANGDGFVPNCDNGDLIAFIVIPDGENCPFTVQPIMAMAPCCGTSSEQTAWGDGKYGGQFPGPNWSTYFLWCPTCP